MAGSELLEGVSIRDEFARLRSTYVMPCVIAGRIPAYGDSVETLHILDNNLHLPCLTPPALT